MSQVRSHKSGSSSYLGTDRHFITSCRVGPGPTRRERESRDSSTSTARCEKKGSTPRERGRFSFRRSGRKQVRGNKTTGYRVRHVSHDDPFICGLFLLFSSDRAPTRDTLHTLYPACTGLTCVSEYTSRPKWPLHWCSTLVRPGPAARPCGRKSTCASYSVAAGAAADG